MILRILLAIVALPFVLIYDVVESARTSGKKFAYIVFVLLFFGGVWFSSYSKLISLTLEATKSSVSGTGRFTDTRTDSVMVPVSGTSMLPTIKNGSKVTLFNPLKYQIERFDIVSVKNQETDGLHYLKRIVGMPGDSIVLKDGYVTINGRILKESYVLNDLPTYGNSRLMECETYQIPDDHYAVFGDNRTVSQDSRIIGFVAKEDIDGIIKTHLHEEYLNEGEQKKILAKSINPETFVKLLNAQRDASVSGTLRMIPLLNTVAASRATTIRDRFDDWKNSQVPVEQVLDKAGYKFNLSHEYVSFGYLDEQSLVDQIMDSVAEKREFTSGKYLDVGVGSVQRTVGACTYPVISVIVAWPSNPNYSKAAIDSWSKELQITADNMQTLQRFIGNNSYDQVKLRRYITVEAQMNDIAKRIYARMKSNEWLTSEDEKDIDLHKKLVDEAWNLDKDLFSDMYK